MLRLVELEITDFEVTVEDEVELGQVVYIVTIVVYDLIALPNNKLLRFYMRNLNLLHYPLDQLFKVFLTLV